MHEWNVCSKTAFHSTHNPRRTPTQSSYETLEPRRLLSAALQPTDSLPADASANSVNLTIALTARNDFNNDGLSDALHYEPLVGVLEVWFMSPGQRSQVASISGVGRGWHLAATGDFNGDNKTDLVWHNPSMNTNAVWLMDGMTRTASYYLPAVAPEWKIVGAGDWNGDGQEDLVWRNSETGAATVWHMNGHQLQANNPFAALPWVTTQNWQISLVDDIDRDGNPDLVWTNATTRQASVWRMNGASPIANGTRGFSLPASNDWTLKTAVDNGPLDSRPLLWHNTRTGSLVTWQLNNLSTPAQPLNIQIAVVNLNPV